MRCEKIKLYENRDDVFLTSYLLTDSPEMLNGVKRPAILICPGGAYLSCSDREAEPIAMKFAAMGYHAFVLNYSVQFPGGMEFVTDSSKIQIYNDRTYPAPMREIGMAFLKIREHEQEWKVDVNRIAVCGFSAGAHNAAMYATHWHEKIIADYLKVDRKQLKPAACILGYCLSDYIFMKKITVRDSMEAAFFASSNKAYVGTEQPNDTILEEISPARHVTEYTPPTFLWATAEDNLVPVQHTIRMTHALADAKIPFEVHIFEEGNHGLSTGGQASAASKSQLNADAAQWVELCDKWLLKRFSLDLPEMTEWEKMLRNAEK